MAQAFIDSPVYTILVFIFVLGVMIFIHELGHFAAAKLLKIRVNAFALGFGPRLIGFRRGETDYRVNALPLGGYVKMAGEQFDEALTGHPDEFQSRPKHQRFLVIVAGPLMNLGLAITLTTSTFMTGVEIPKYLKDPAVIGWLTPDSGGEKAGLKTGDRILSVSGQSTPTWEDVQLAVGMSPGQEIPLEFERQGKRQQVKVQIAARGNPEIGDAGLQPLLVNSRISRIEPGTPADRAGLKSDDILETVRSEQQSAFDEKAIQNLILANEGKELEFVIRRDEERLTMKIVPVRLPYPNSDQPPQPRTGFSFKRETIIEQYPWQESIVKSFEQNYKYTLATFDILGRLLTGKASLNAMSGPIDIAHYSGEAARMGLRALLTFMAFISLQLGIFNLLPIPVLDGGLIFMMLVEAVLRRDLSLKLKERITQVGLMFLVLLMGVVIINDLGKHFFK